MMMSTNIKTTAEELLQPIIDKEQLELVDIEYVKEGRDWFLRVYIDKVDGVTIDECEYVSKLLSDKLDEVDLIPGHYYLEEIGRASCRERVEKLEDDRRVMND